MLAVAAVLIVLGVLLLFLFPWGGVVAGIVGLLLLAAYAAGIGRRATQGRP